MQSISVRILKTSLWKKSPALFLHRPTHSTLICHLGKWRFLPSRSSIVFSSLETVLSANSARVSASFSLSDRSLISSSYLSSFSEYYGRKTNQQTPKVVLKRGKKAGEMPQRLRALVAFTEGWGSGPSTHMDAHNHFVSSVPGDLTPCPTVQTYMLAKHLHI